ncbi:hypothetical protein J4E93_005302 [Alternaria ventricosa]|uniref:uncharacterized protein n=1 Tax=Alternaria ventricosa TaxID=1187951 RepID=UPI0020C3F0E8|nr:uncharacterized protein J4E93_005302 [Alternaria ventricosa]KAI4645724.1 hypothetical protein J4E93_005302 [Alternaria ventricosa]
MKALDFLSWTGLVALVASERLITTHGPLLNISAPHISRRNAIPIDFAGFNPADPGFVVHTRAISDEEYEKAICRGQKLFLAMTRDGNQGTRYIDPLHSPWDGSLEAEGLKWAWDMWEDEDSWCAFGHRGMTTAFKGLSISDKSLDDGGDNQCFSAFHYNSPAVLFDPKDPFYLDDPDGRMLPIDKQYYLDPSGKRQRCTASTYTFGVNPKAGVLFFLSRSSPFETAKMLWKYTPKTSELPELRASSDFAWGLWNKLRGKDNLGDIRKIFSLYINNKETQSIIDKAIAKQAIKELKKWPGTEIDPKSEEGLAIIGSANGRAAGYFLAQHKKQLGKDKYISKINVFLTDKEDPMRNILFYVDDVLSPPPEMAEPEDKDKGKDKGTGLVESNLIDGDGDGTSIVRRHVVFVGRSD